MFNADIIKKIKEQLLASSQTIAVAESVTAGLLQLSLSSAEEATKIFQGGITAYNIGQKCRHLNVNPVHALSCNCVSEKMARDMAVSAAAMFTSDWGIGVTGYSTPVPESGNHTYAFFSIALRGVPICNQRVEGSQGEPFNVQLTYVNAILIQLLQALEHPDSEAH